MTEKEKERLFEELEKIGVLKVNHIKQVINNEIDFDEEKYTEDEIGITPNGVRYIKNLVYEYLTNNGYPITAENIELAAKMGNIPQAQTKIIKQHELDNATDEEIHRFMELALLKEIALLRKDLLANTLMEYEVRILSDRSGGTDPNELSDTLTRMSHRGWRLKTALTNELGKNALSVSTGAGTFGTNTTVDQLILIFERPYRMHGDKGGANILEHIRLSN